MGPSVNSPDNSSDSLFRGEKSDLRREFEYSEIFFETKRAFLIATSRDSKKIFLSLLKECDLLSSIDISDSSSDAAWINEETFDPFLFCSEITPVVLDFLLYTPGKPLSDL
ncbi:hypothetical protein AVEN_182219-1 [Araneus ventricosus]|uniref:Uncharacterized protein n=1 Tax=Araneus ventricosus TaxID=182803 RepID=A0A4Y2QW56_ARAVE|nr:hypothetical protein AVEN_182219-1 [Araneus ventricosus]